MALQKALTTEHGIELSNAYIRVDGLMGSKKEIYATVGIYKDADSAVDKLPISTRTFSFIPDVSDASNNYHKQTYVRIKSTDEFTDAVDC